MKPFTILAGIVALLGLLFGYALNDGAPVQIAYWARNIFGVAFMTLIVIGLGRWALSLKKAELPYLLAPLSPAILMVACWGLTYTRFAGLVPTWFANGWTEIIVGVMSAVVTAFFAALIFGLFGGDDE